MSCLPCLALMGYDGPSQMSGMGAMGCGDRPCAKCAAAHAAQGMGALLEPVRFVNFGPNKTGVGGNWAGNLGLRGLDESSDAQAWIQAFLNGTLAADMQALKNKLNSNQSSAQQMYNEAHRIGSSEGIRLANQALQQAASGLQSYYEAVDYYNQVASAIRTATFGFYSPQSLGWSPIDLITEPILQLLRYFIAPYSAAQGSAASSSTTLQQLADVIRAAGGAAQDISNAGLKFTGIGLLLLGLGVAGYLYYNKKKASSIL